MQLITPRQCTASWLLAIIFAVVPAFSQTPTSTDQRGLGISIPTPTQTPVANAAAASSTDRPELIVQTGHTFPPLHLAFSPDNKLVAAVSFNDSAIKLWETATGRELRSLSHDSGGGGAFGLSGVSAFAFSPDGRLFASGASDNTIKIWDVLSGRELHSMTGATSGIASSAGVSALAFSPDGRLLASASIGESKLWDVASGQAARTIEMGGAGSYAMSIAFTPDGREVAALLNGTGARGETNLQYWDASSGSPTRSVELEGQPAFALGGGGVVFTPDGRVLAVTLDQDKYKVWSVTSSGAKSHHTLPFGQHGNSFVKFSPDGRLFAYGDGSKTVVIFDASSGQQIRTLNVPVFSKNFPVEGVFGCEWSADGRTLATGASDGQIRLWDAATGREQRALVGHSNAAFGVAFNDAGTRLYAGNRTVWETNTGLGLRSINAATSPLGLISRDGRLLAALNLTDQTVNVWDLEKQHLLYTLPQPAGLSAERFAFSPDGHLLAMIYGVSQEQQDKQQQRNDQQSQMDVKQMQRAQKEAMKQMMKDPSAMMKNPGALMNIYNQQLGQTQSAKPEAQIKLWNMQTGQEARTLVGHSVRVTSINFSADGRTLVSGGSGGEVKVWDVSSGQLVNSLVGAGNAPSSGGMFGMPGMPAIPSISSAISQVDAVAFSPDGRFIASGGKEMNNSLDPSSIMSAAMAQMSAARSSSGGGGGRGRGKGKGAQPVPVPDPQDFYKNISFKLTGPVTLWDAKTGQPLHKLEGHESGTSAVAFSSDGSLLATGGADNTIKIWDVSSGQALRELRGQTSRANSLAFTPDTRILASTNDDGSTRLWDVKSGEHLATLVSLNDGSDWLVITPDGLFDGSPNAWNQILWRYEHNTFNVAPIEWFFNEFYYPGLLSDIFAGKRPRATQDISRKDRRQPQVKLALNGADAATGALTTRNVTVKIDVLDAAPDQNNREGCGARDLRLFRNGSLVKVWHGDVLKGGASTTLEATIPIVAGENRLTAYAFNRDNVKSKDATLMLTGADSLKRAGTAYILAIGVNSYANPQYNLKYALADAQEFAAEVKRQQEKLHRFDHIEVVTLADTTATKENIMHALADLAAKTQPEDEVVVYFAGHGTAQRNQFYLIPHDLGYTGSRTKLTEAGLQSVLTHSISDRELEPAFEKLDAGQILLIIDACNSGQALEAEEKRRGPMNSKGLAQLAYEKGMYILTAAQSFQAAQEASQVGHGLLTYALVEEGLRAGAADDDPKDGNVFAHEWLNYAETRVPQMQIDKMKQARSLGGDLSFTDDERGLDIEHRSGQRPRVFYRRELEVHPLVVAQP